MRISSNDVNTVWNGMTAAVRIHGDSFYLTKHGHILANTLQSLFPHMDIHSIRVNVASMSRSVVYYVTPPLAPQKLIIANKFYALKIVADIPSFEHEIQSLKLVEEMWRNERCCQKFYYITNSDELNPTWSISRQYLFMVVAREAAVSDPQYGVIVMRPASRNRLSQVDDTDGAIFGQLLQSLSVAHKVTQREGWYTDYSGRIWVQKGSFQHMCCGRRAFDIIQENDLELYSLVEIDW
eukprot:CAMPEP_0170081592 /NCGR_PEP_ID=MMETSP0019_2-20121128/17408_1 /TAXON_ID=98059 /ORGANISM="Dinobryon sp., Strain UTEXLB2267" /LENGTH=237 /DNA_ID=CAMNT_0010296073 /DNA_START=645 /DNA_END=1356 /DNA_ORIENTATION=-